MRARTMLAVLSVGLSAGCGMIFGFEDPNPPAGTGAGGMTSSSASTGVQSAGGMSSTSTTSGPDTTVSSGTSTTSSGGGCTNTSDCPSGSGCIASYTCSGGTCVPQYVAQGMTEPGTVPMACSRMVCDGAGNVSMIELEAGASCGPTTVKSQSLCDFSGNCQDVNSGTCLDQTCVGGCCCHTPAGSTFCDDSAGQECSQAFGSTTCN